MQIRNSVTLIGHLGQDPVRRTTRGGKAFATFSLATNESYRDAAGQRQTRTEWHNVIAFGKLAELLLDTLRKGSQVALVGTLRYRKWVDQHQQPRTTTSIHAEQFTYLGAPTPRRSPASPALVPGPPARPASPARPAPPSGS